MEAEYIEIASDGGLKVPDKVIIPFIEGDGVGPDIWRAARLVLDASLNKAYRGLRNIFWKEVLAGAKAEERTGSRLPQQTIDDIRLSRVAIKGPLETPVGEGIRSLNVALRQVLDLYACVRPVRYFPGAPSPLKNPEKVEMTVFRENTEDVYAGIEFAAGTKESQALIERIEQMSGAKIRPQSAVGLKPMSEFSSKRLIRRAIEHALKERASSVTLVHKGNIMKFTEGAFRKWGYELAKDEFSEQVIFETDLGDLTPKARSSKLVIKDRIADSMFQQVLLRPEQYSVLATSNLNGDYLSDALAALVGGLGIAPGANIGDEAAVFEATHGTAPKYAGLDKVNPSSLILSGQMLLRFIGWDEAAETLEKGFRRTIEDQVVTYDLARMLENVRPVSCSAFAQAIVDRL